MAAGDHGPKYRTLPGFPGVVQSLVLVALPVSGILFILNLPSYLGQVVYREQFVALFLGFALTSVFLGIPAGGKAPRDRVPWYDLAGLAAAAAPCLYVAVYYPKLVFVLGYVTPTQIVLGSLLILVVLESIRRALGWPLVILVAVFLFYGRFTDLFPGILQGKATSWSRLSSYLFLDPNSYLAIVGIAATIVLGFIVFGHILNNFDGGSFIIEMAYALLGKFRGGPAKIAILSSSLFGTLSGSAVANVVTTGMITIPMMKKTGMRPHQAGAVEAVASTGGQIMPPVMGVAAFLIAEFLQISYVKVILAAFIPAFLYYLALFFQVDFEAGKDGRVGLPPESLPRIGKTLKEGWFFILALLFLIYTLIVVALPPATAGVLSALFTLLLVVLRRQGRNKFFRRLYTALEDSGKTLIDICIVLAAAGFIMGVMGISGLGFNLSFALIEIAKGNVLLLLLVSAATCLVLGMGMPTTAAYVLVAVLVAPALIQLGILPLAAHLFIFYFAILSAITPPVALAAFAGAAIAGSEPMRTGFEAMRLALVAYIVPFLFVFSSVLIGEGPVFKIALGVATAVFGIWILGAAITGFLFDGLSVLKRTLLAIGGVGLLIPVGLGGSFGWISDLGGAALVIPLVVWEWRKTKREQARVLAVAPE